MAALATDVEVPVTSVEPASATDRRTLTAFLGAYSLSMLGDRFGELAVPLVVLVSRG